jgi:RimJ/RimL family protein N-acetyltransferase
MTLNVQLRDPIEADLPVLYEYQLDPEASRMAAVPPREWHAFLAHWTKISRNETDVHRIILADGQVAGSIGTWEKDGLRLVGYVLGRDHWGQGVGTRALALLVDLVTIRPLHAFVAKHNVGSMRVLEKNGFAVVREQTSYEHGMVIDEFLMRLG